MRIAIELIICIKNHTWHNQFEFLEGEEIEEINGDRENMKKIAVKNFLGRLRDNEEYEEDEIEAVISTDNITIGEVNCICSNGEDKCPCCSKKEEIGFKCPSFSSSDICEFCSSKEYGCVYPEKQFKIVHK